MAVDVTPDGIEGIHELRRSLTGRDEELRRLEEAIEAGARSVALFGPPGVGKTALASHFFYRHFAEESGRVVLVDGTGHEELGGLVGQIASGLAIELGGGDSIPNVAERLGTAIEHRGIGGLIFDRVGLLDEDLGDFVSSLLDAEFDLRCLFTSQKPPSFGVDEKLEVGPLALEEAVELFCEWLPGRERSDLADREVERIEKIVERLDRIPLALRLGSNRYQLVGGRSLSQRLQEGLDVLETESTRRGDRGIDEAIGWAWSQLDAAERDLLEQCSVFSGYFSVEAAESVVEPANDAEWRGRSLLEILEGPVDRSLLRTRRAREDEGGRLLGLYRSVRTFARERCDSPGLARRHAEWFVGRDPGLYASSEEIRGLVDAQRDLERIVDRFADESPALALRALLMLDRLYGEQGLEKRYRRLVGEGEELSSRVEDPRLRGRVLWQFALAYIRWGEFDRADERLEEAFELAEAAGDAELATLVLVRRSRCNWRRGKFDAAEEALAIADREYVDDGLHPLARAEYHGFRGGMLYNDRQPDLAADHFRRARDLYARRDREARAALSETWCAMTRAGVGALEESRERFTAAISRLRELGAEGLLIGTLNESAFDSTIVGELDLVIDRLEEALDLSRKLGRRVMEGRTLNHLGIAYANAGELQKARRYLDEARAMLEEAGDYRFMSEAMIEKAFVLVRLGDRERAREQLEKVAEIRDGFETDVRWCIRAAQWSLAENDPVEAYRRLEPAMEVDGVDRLPLNATRLYAWAAIAQWKRGRREDADALVERARDRIRPVADCTIHCLVEVVEGWVGQVDLGEGDWEGWIGEREDEAVSIELRFLRDLYQNHLGGAEAEREANASSRLDIGPECRWFAPPGEERVELGRSKVLRNLLEVLVERRIDQPGQPVEMEELIASGWPEQKLVESAGQNRVYVSISKLRNLGLDDLIVTGEKAYYLDPDVPVRAPFS